MGRDDPVWSPKTNDRNQSFVVIRRRVKDEQRYPTRLSHSRGRSTVPNRLNLRHRRVTRREQRYMVGLKAELTATVTANFQHHY